MWKRAQAAMEFLMTYGWAILVVLVVIAALSYFGVLNPSNLLPERCELPMGLSCKDYQVMSTGGVGGLPSITMSIENGMGEGIQFVSWNVTTTIAGQVIGCYNASGPLPFLPNGQAVDILLTCNPAYPEGVVGSATKYKYNFVMYYYKEGSSDEFPHSMRGSLQAKVEQ